jgi:Arc/MetJ family transcription regulator
MQKYGQVDVSLRAAEPPNLTTVLADSRLVESALQAIGTKSARDVVELGLRTLIRLAAQEELRQMQGTVDWEGNLEAMRADR